jgi:hypothetical protein
MMFNRTGDEGGGEGESFNFKRLRVAGLRGAPPLGASNHPAGPRRLLLLLLLLLLLHPQLSQPPVFDSDYTPTILLVVLQ